MSIALLPIPTTRIRRPSKSLPSPKSSACSCSPSKSSEPGTRGLGQAGTSLWSLATTSRVEALAVVWVSRSPSLGRLATGARRGDLGVVGLQCGAEGFTISQTG